MNDKTGDVGASWINGRQMVLADDLAYLMDGERIYCVRRSEHAAASQERQEWFLKARELRSDPQKVAEAKQKMRELTDVGIVWQYPSDFDDVLIAAEDVVVAGGMNQLVALDRQTGKLLWEQEVEGNVRGLALDEQILTVSTDAGHIYAFAAKAPGTDEARQWPRPYVDPFPQDDLTEFYRNAASQILERSGQTDGYCLVIGNADGRLAYEISKQSDLVIYAVDADPESVRASQTRLQKAGLHGTRITVVHANYDELPFSNYFANLVVCDSFLQTGKAPCEPRDVSRHLKPCGGVAMLGRPQIGGAENQAAGEQAVEWLTGFYQQNEGELVADSPWYLLRRGKLAGAGNWSHQYGNAANTSYTADHRIRDGLGVLWYGDPGPSAMINRHEAAGAPLSTNGRMFIQGTDRLMAYDAYNGTFLWEHENPGAIRTGVFNNRETHNLAASDDALYVAIDQSCLALDAATGKVLAEYKTPEPADGIERAWAYLAYDQGQLFGTSTIRDELEKRLRRRGLTVKTQTDAVFAVDTATGNRMWEYRGRNILHTTIAIGPEHMYFIDSSLTPEERQQLYLQDKTELASLTGEEARKAEEKVRQMDVRLAVAIDRKTGAKIWERPVDVTDTTNVSAGGGSLTLMYANGHVVLCGANANGHYWKQFLAGEFEKRKIVVLDAANGDQLWAKNANYMNRPAVIGSEVFAEPWAFDLHTGKPKTRPHPLTRDESQWRFSRPGHHCGVITATPNMMFFRSGFIGYYDLYEDSGTRHFAGQRLGCWVNAIPGNGLVMIPEASAGCVCQFSIASTVVLEPKSESNSWGIFSAVGPQTPVKRIGINFGAPGDRKDVSGDEWIGYPRPNTRERLEFVIDLKPQLRPGGGWFSRNLESLESIRSEKPWIFASGARGLQRFEVPLLGKDDKPASYLVRLYFANDDRQDAAKLDVTLQGTTVARGVAIDPDNAAPKILEFGGVEVDGSLLVELEHLGETAAPIAAIECLRED